MENLSKNIGDITTDKHFIIPLYQRNFAWTEKQVAQLLHDIYENYKINPASNYFIGSLIVLARSEELFEVVDGQQRLTILSLLVKILKPKLFKTPFLEYDSRNEVNEFLKAFYTNTNCTCPLTTFSSAIETIKTESLDPRNPNSPSLERLASTDFGKFADYVLNNVQIIFVQIPKDTDVASYFEIMNNRGLQLQKHEILKALLLRNIETKEGEDIENLRSIYSRIWDSCSQMDRYIQSEFKHNNSIQDRVLLFGDNYDSLDLSVIPSLITKSSQDIYNGDEESSIDEILDQKTPIYKDEETDSEEEDIIDIRSIIDFPNFLMHVFKLKYNDEYNKAAAEDIPLNEKDLLRVYNLVKDVIDSRDFIESLLFYRTVFDRFIVKVRNDPESNSQEDAEDNFKWILQKPQKYSYRDKNNNWRYKNNPNDSFTKLQDNIIMALSMLQVSQPQRIYKNYLYQILSYFKKAENLNISAQEYLKILNGIILDTYKQNKQYASIDKNVEYNEETAVNYYTNGLRFLLNFIDYLYWTAKCNNIEDIADLEYVNDFVFRYNNSIEHHLPQSKKGKIDNEVIDSLGNLCLISKSMNSRLNNESPVGKADSSSTGKYYRKDLPAKRKIMYDMTNSNKQWQEKEITTHYHDVLNLIQKRNEILKLDNLDTGDPTTLRAIIATHNKPKTVGTVWNGEKKDIYTIDSATIETIKIWLQENPLKSLDDYINDKLENDKELAKSDWRYAFVKYPFLVKYCQNGHIGFFDNNKYLVMKESRGTKHTSRDLKTYLLYKRIKESRRFSNEFVNIDYEYLYIPFWEQCPYFQENIPEEYLIPCCLEIWPDYKNDGTNWCYRLYIARSGNSTEARILLNNGWEKLEKNYYYNPQRPFLFKGDTLSIDKSIDKAFSETLFLMDELKKMTL